MSRESSELHRMEAHLKELQAELEESAEFRRQAEEMMQAWMDEAHKLQAVVDAAKHLVSKYRDELMHRCDVDALEQRIKEVESVELAEAINKMDYDDAVAYHFPGEGMDIEDDAYFKEQNGEDV